MSHPFRVAAESKDLDLLKETLRGDVVLHSPILFRGFEGRDAAIYILRHVVEVFEGFRYVGEAEEDGLLFLRFKADVGDKQLEGIDVLELDEQGKVRELTVFIRPLSALTAFNERMKARLAAAPPA